ASAAEISPIQTTAKGPRRRRCFIGEFLVPVQAHRTKFRFRASGCSESCHLPYAKRKPSEPFYFTREPRSSQREDYFFFRTGAAGMDWTSLQPLTTHHSLFQINAPATRRVSG